MQVLLASSPLLLLRTPDVTLFATPQGPAIVLDTSGKDRLEGRLSPSLTSSIGFYVVSVIKQGGECLASMSFSNF